MNVHELFLNVQGLLGRTINSTQDPQEKELFRVAASALMFLSATGQYYPLEDYLNRDKDDPPHAVASFETLEDAERWLEAHAEPPHGAFVLVADEYHLVVYVRDTNYRRIFPHPIFEGYLDQIKRDAPPAVASLSTREEALAWLRDQPDPSKRTYLLIAGSPHVALHHRNIKHFSIYPLNVGGREEA